MGRKNALHPTPRVYTSKAGRRYVRTSEVLGSTSARTELHRLATLAKEQKAGATSNKTVAASDRKK